MKDGRLKFWTLIGILVWILTPFAFAEKGSFATPIEVLLEESQEIFWGEVVEADPSDNVERADRLKVKILGSLSGPELVFDEVVTVDTYGSQFGFTLPQEGETKIFFVKKVQDFWYPVRPDGIREDGFRYKVTRFLKIRQQPSLFLEVSDLKELRLALSFLKPTYRDRFALYSLLSHPQLSIRLQVVRSLYQVDPIGAGEWFFRRWKAENKEDFATYLEVAGEMFDQRFGLPSTHRHEKEQLVELYRYTWWLQNPTTQGLAYRQLPHLEKALGEGKAWALEAIALFPSDESIPRLTSALRAYSEKFTGRILNLLSSELQRPNPKLTEKLKEGLEERLHDTLFWVESKDYENTLVRNYIRSEMDRVIYLLRSYH